MLGSPTQFRIILYAPMIPVNLLLTAEKIAKLWSTVNLMPINGRRATKDENMAFRPLYVIGGVKLDRVGRLTN